jgi:hypothetical protein
MYGGLLSPPACSTVGWLWRLQAGLTLEVEHPELEESERCSDSEQQELGRAQYGKNSTPKNPSATGWVSPTVLRWQAEQAEQDRVQALQLQEAMREPAAARPISTEDSAAAARPISTEDSAVAARPISTEETAAAEEPVASPSPTASVGPPSPTPSKGGRWLPPHLRKKQQQQAEPVGAAGAAQVEAARMAAEAKEEEEIRARNDQALKLQMQRAVGEQILSRQDKYAARVEMQPTEEAGMVWEEAGRHVWAPSPPGSSPRSRPSSSASTARSFDSPLRPSRCGGEATAAAALAEEQNGGGDGGNAVDMAGFELRRLRVCSVRFVRQPQVHFFQRLPMTDLVGDHREPENPNYGFLGMVRDHRLSAFANKARLRTAFNLWARLDGDATAAAEAEAEETEEEPGPGCRCDDTNAHATGGSADGGDGDAGGGGGGALERAESKEEQEEHTESEEEQEAQRASSSEVRETVALCSRMEPPPAPVWRCAELHSAAAAPQIFLT